MNKKEEPKRRSLNDRLDAELANNEEVTVAGLTPPVPEYAAPVAQPKPQEVAPTPEFATKKATTIMPKEVFNKLQMYCTETDTPKHRVLYLFLIDGLLKAGSITEAEHTRFKGLAALLVTTTK